MDVARQMKRPVLLLWWRQRFHCCKLQMLAITFADVCQPFMTFVWAVQETEVEARWAPLKEEFVLINVMHAAPFAVCLISLARRNSTQHRTREDVVYAGMHPAVVTSGSGMVRVPSCATMATRVFYT